MKGLEVGHGLSQVCPECGGVQLHRDVETGELVCRSCGVVVSSTLLDTGPEWSTFTQEQRQTLSRTGAPLTLMIHDKGLSTYLGWRGRDNNRGQLSPDMSTRLYRLRRWQRRSSLSDNRDRNLSRALNEIARIGMDLSLPGSVVDTCSMLYRRALSGSLIRGRSIQSIVGACVYMACRQCGVVRTIGDVAGSCNMSDKEVARCYRFLYGKLNQSVPQFRPVDYIGSVVSKLGLRGDTERLSKAVLREVYSLKLTSGRGPAGVAAACVYISTKITGDHRTQEDISRVAQVTEVTIRNRYKEFLERLEFEIRL